MAGAASPALRAVDFALSYRIPRPPLLISPDPAAQTAVVYSWWGMIATGTGERWAQA
jgi:hypothetical protein